MPKSWILVSSDHNTFTQFSSESLANFRRAVHVLSWAGGPCGRCRISVLHEVVCYQLFSWWLSIYNFFEMRFSGFFCCYSVFHWSNKPTIKIIDWSFLCQWANVQNQQGIKYFFPPLYIYLPTHPSIRISIYSSTWLSIIHPSDFSNYHPSIWLSIHPFVCPSIQLSIHLSIWHPSIHPSDYLFDYLSVIHPSMHLFD